jgi:hypothetical protein
MLSAMLVPAASISMAMLMRDNAHGAAVVRAG